MRKVGNESDLSNVTMNTHKLFSCLAVIGLCFGAWTSLNAETTPSDFEYKIEGDEHIVIQKYIGTELDVSIPSEIDGLPVTKLDGLTFYDVPVTSVSIPASVSEIGSNVFIECESLVSITVHHNNKFFSSKDGVLFDKLKTTLLRYPPAKEGIEYQVPSTVTQLGDSAFEVSQNLERVSLPEAVRELPHRAFAICKKLKQVSPAGSLTSIGDLAFASCSQLEDIPVYSGTTVTITIGGYAFYRCYSLQNVYLPNPVTNIGPGCFEDCTGLTKAHLGKGINMLQCNTFAGCTNLTNVKLPDNLISIAVKEFENCDQLKELTFPPSFQTMTENCFAGTHLDKIIFKGNTPVIIGDIATYDPVWNPEPLSPEFEIFSDHYPEIYYFDKTTGWNIEDYVLDSFEPYYQENGNNFIKKIEMPLAAHCGMKGIPLIAPPSDFEYRIEGDEAIITNYLGTDLDVVFPNEINGKTVTGIDYAFWENDKNNITSCQLPENLKYIGRGLFYHCTNLTEIQIPAGVETIGSRAFSGCNKLTELHIPNGVKSIGYWVIARCKKIKTINIPASVEDIYGGLYSESSVMKMNAFSWSDGLEEITVDEENPFYRAIDGVLFNKEGTTLLQYPCGRPGAEYVIPEGVTKLAWGSFLETIYLETVRFPSSLETINEYSFFKCSSLTSIDIPDTVQTIDSVAFALCSNLKQVIVGTGVTSLKTYAFVSCPALESVYFKGNCPEIDESIFNGDVPNPYYPNVYYVEGTEGWDDPAKLDWLDPEKLFTWTPEAPPSDFEYRIEGDEAIITNYLGTDLDVVFPNEIEGKPVTGIDYRFYDAADLSGNHNKNNITSCQLPENLRYIRNRLFDHCTNLATIQIPANVETIGELAFSGCYKLTELHIPNGVKTIGSDIIAICNNIKTINIPASVEDIYGGLYSESFGMNAFAWAYGLEEITVDEENPFYRAIDGVLFNKEGTTLLQYPCGRPGAEYVIPEGVTKLAWASFLKAGYLETVRFPSSLKVINEASFHQCTSLTSIDIPDTIQAIRAGAFQGCSNLKQVTIGTGVELLEGHAFSKCQVLENVYFKGNCPDVDYLGLPDLVLPGYSLPGVIFTRNEPCPNVYYVKGTEGWDDPAKLDWLDPEKLFTWTPEAPYLFVSRKDPAGMKLVFSGELQSSDDLENWTTVPAESPYQDAPTQGKQKFFRVKK